MTIVGRLELDHPPLGTSGGQSLWDSVTAIYTKLGDACNPRFYQVQDLADGTSTDLDHNYQVAFDQIRWDLYNWDTGTGELTRIFDTSGYTVEATPGNETTQLRVTNNTGGEVDIVVQLFNDPIDLGELENVDLTTTPPEDGQALVYDGAATEWVAGASGDSSFKLQSISGEILTIKKGFLILGSAVELYAPSDLAVDFSIAERQDNGDYVVYINLALLPDETDLNGRPVRVVTESEIETVRTSKPYELDLQRQVPIGTVERNLGVLENQQTLATRRHTDDTATISALEFEVSKQDIGDLGETDNIRAGHVLTANSFPSAGDPSYYNLANNGNDNSGNARNFTDNGSPVYGVNGIKGVGGAVQLNGTDAFLSSTDTFFNPGGTAFTCGGWFKHDSLPSAAAMIAQWDEISYFLRTENGDLILYYSNDGAGVENIAINQSVSVDEWFHIVMAYDGDNMKIYFNGTLIAQQDIGALHVSSTPSFQLGSQTSAGIQFFPGIIDEFFFENGLTYSDDDIAKLFAHQIDHNRNIETKSQRWVGNLRSGDHAVTVFDFLVSMDKDRCWIDLNGQADNAAIVIRLFDDGPLGSTTAVRSMERQVTAAELDAQLPISHRLPTKPTQMELWAEVVADSGDFEVIDSSAYLLANDTQIVSTGTSLASILGNDTRVHLITSVGASAVVVNEAATTSEGGGEAGINYVQNSDAETDATTNTVQVDVTTTEETTEPLIGSQSFRVSSTGVADGYHGWNIDTIDNAFIDRTKLKFTGIAKTDGPGWAIDIWNVTDSEIVPGTETDLPDNNQASFSVGAVPQSGKSYLPRLRSKSAGAGSICLADRIFYGFQQTGAADNAGWKVYKEVDIQIIQNPSEGTISTRDGWYKPQKDPITGDWTMEFQAYCAIPSQASFTNPWTIELDGVTFGMPANASHAVTAWSLSSTGLEHWPTLVDATPNGNQLRFFSPDTGGNFQGAFFSGTVRLAGKPTWADYEPNGVALNNETLNANSKFSAFSQNESVASGAIFQFAIPDYNEGGGSFSNGQYTVPANGYYSVSTYIRPNVTENNFEISIRLDSEVVANSFLSNGVSNQLTKTFFAQKGQLIDIYNANAAVTTLNAAKYSGLSIDRVADFTSETTVVADLATQETAGFVSGEASGSWNPTTQTALNITGVLDYQNPRWERIGNMVFAVVKTIANLDITSANVDSNLVISTDGLPFRNDATRYYGHAFISIASVVESWPCVENSTSGSDLFFGGRIANSGSAFVTLKFWYFIDDDAT